MAPWTGKLIQLNLDKMTASSVDETAIKLVNLLETRSQVQKLAILVSQRVQRAYTPTFHQPFDEKRRFIADSLVAALLRCFANLRRQIKGVPTKEGLSGIPLFKTDLLGAALSEKKGIAAVATSLYNALAMSCGEVKTIILACLDKKYVNDADKVGEAVLLLEYAARELDQEDQGAMDSIMESVKQQLDNVAVFASERKKCGERIIPSLYDRYWDLVQKRSGEWKQSLYNESDTRSTLTAAAAALKEHQLLKAISIPSDMADHKDSTTPIDSLVQPAWSSDFIPIDVINNRKDSDATQIDTVMSPTLKETQQSTSTTSIKQRTLPPRREDDDQYTHIAYGQAVGNPSQPRLETLSTTNTAEEQINKPTLTFDDEDDSLTLHLDVQAGSPIKVKFDADTRLGDAKRIAKLLASSLNNIPSQNADQSIESIKASTSSPPIQFLSNGRIGQMLKSSSTSDIFVQYPHTMTLLQARQIGDNLASAVESYSR